MGLSLGEVGICSSLLSGRTGMSLEAKRPEISHKGSKTLCSFRKHKGWPELCGHWAQVVSSLHSAFATGVKARVVESLFCICSCQSKGSRWEGPHVGWGLWVFLLPAPPQALLVLREVHQPFVHLVPGLGLTWLASNSLKCLMGSALGMVLLAKGLKYWEF
jgi:hypothetical protein